MGKSNLKILCLLTGITYKDIVEATGISSTNISAMNQGVRRDYQQVKDFICERARLSKEEVDSFMAAPQEKLQAALLDSIQGLAGCQSQNVKMYEGLSAKSRSSVNDFIRYLRDGEERWGQ